MTKHLPEAAMLAYLATAGCEFREGRPEGAPQLEDGAARQRIAMVVLSVAEWADGGGAVVAPSYRRLGLPTGAFWKLGLADASGLAAGVRLESVYG